jgi:hypothetical protein
MQFQRVRQTHACRRRPRAAQSHATVRHPKATKSGTSDSASPVAMTRDGTGVSPIHIVRRTLITPARKLLAILFVLLRFHGIL